MPDTVMNIEGDYIPDTFKRQVIEMAPAGATHAWVTDAGDQVDVLYYDSPPPEGDSGETAIDRQRITIESICEHTLDAYGTATASEIVTEGFAALHGSITALRALDPSEWTCGHSALEVAVDLWMEAESPD